MLAQEYPVTQPYGYDPSYPLNNGFHTGIDYGCPLGTPVLVNGVTIGLSNNTGASTGPHLHVGKYVNGVVEDPGVGNGFTFTSAVVYDTGSDDINGNYVRINGDGALWNYLHLETVLVNKGQELTEATVDEVTITKEAYEDYEYWKAIGQQLSYTKAWAAIGGDWKQVMLVIADLELYADFVKSSPAWNTNGGDLTKLEVVLKGTAATVLAPGTYEVQ